MFSQRTNWELAQNKISGILEQIRRTGGKFLDLTESNPTRCGFSFPSRSILSALSQPRHMVYEPSPQGNLEAREAVSAYYAQKNIPVDPSRVFLTASTSEGYSFLFRLLANPGECVALPCPSYPLFEFLAGLNDLQMAYYSLEYSQGWHVDLESLHSALGPSVKALVVVNPNNPTGSCVHQDELKEINKICRKQNTAIIADEVFLDYNFEEKNFLPSLAGNNETLTFVLGGLSKTLALPQMKLSWIVVNGPEKIVAEAAARLEIIADTYLSVNTPVQNALKQWLQLRPVIQKEILFRICQNRSFLLDFSQGKNFECLSGEGGWYEVLKAAEDMDEERLVLDLLEKDRVFVHPGYFFDFEEGSHLVVSLLPQPEVFREGLARISARMKR